jgi:pantoate--beta-alanine ligase
MVGLRQRGLRIGLVPTMGYLHRGHQALIEAAQKQADVTVVSIFVNPLQFGPKEDLATYPRDLEGDLAKAEAAGASFCLAPTPAALYPDGFQTTVEVNEITQGLCGGKRPGHFRGVTTVVLKLFNLAQPHVAVFGEKDYQQLLTIKRMTQDLALPISIVSVPTIREPDGLALSSRNAHLSLSERQDALVLKRALDAIEQAIASGDHNRESLLLRGQRELASVVSCRVDYLELVDAETLRVVSPMRTPTQALVAAFIGKTRLIDNRRVL